MIFSKTKLGSDLDKIKKLLIENGYIADVLLSCINQKLANFAAEKSLVQKEFWNLSTSRFNTQSCEDKRVRFLTGTLQVNNGE